MRIGEVEALREAIAKGAQVPVVLLAGGDDAAREGIEEVLAEALRRHCSPVSMVRMDVATQKDEVWERLADLGANVPLFGDGFVVSIANCDAAKAPEALKRFLADPPFHLRLALFGDRKAEKTGLGKAVAAVGRVITVADVREPVAVRLAIDAARDAGLVLDPHAAQVLVDLVGTDRAAIASAIETFTTFRGTGGRIGEDDLRGLVTRTRKAPPWELDDAIGARDLQKALKVVLHELEGSSANAMRVLSGITRLARQLLLARELVASRVTDQDAMERLGIRFAFQWERLRTASGRFRTADLQAFLKDVPGMEMQAKRGPAHAQTLVIGVLCRLLTEKPRRP